VLASRVFRFRHFSQKLTDQLVSGYLVEPEKQVGVINAFTNAAQKLGPLQRIEMERFAGTLLEASFPPIQASKRLRFFHTPAGFNFISKDQAEYKCHRSRAEESQWRIRFYRFALTIGRL
jgi:hypothetical protein